MWADGPEDTFVELCGGIVLCRTAALPTGVDIMIDQITVN
jgi:hypothetical protein